MISHKKDDEADGIPQKLEDADHADDLTLLTNTPALAKSLLHSLEQVAGGIGLYVNANKTVHIF